MIKFLIAGVVYVGLLGQIDTLNSVHAASIERVEVVSNKTFEDTIKHLKWQFGGYGMSISWAMDHREILKRMNVEIPGAMIFEVMRAPWLTDVFKHNPSAALALPLRIIAIEGTDGKTVVSYYRPSALIGAAATGDLSEFAEKLDKKLAKIVALATK